MKHIFLVLVAIFCTSCKLFHSYPDNTHWWYHKGITKNDKLIVNQQDSLIKDWHSTNSLGDYAKGKLKVFRTIKKNVYFFVEMGEWVERHSVSTSRKWKAETRDTIVYDMFGNITSRKFYMDEAFDKIGFYLKEEWTSEGTDSLRQTIVEYYPNGQQKVKLKLTVVNANEDLSDKFKYKNLVFRETHKENGEICNEDELEIDEWYEPRTLMKEKK